MQKLEALAAWWGPTKVAIEDYFGLSPDAVHVHVSVLLLLGFALLTRRPLNNWLPWLLTLAVETSNEIIDLFQPSSLEASLPAGFHDLKNTMFLPTLIVLLMSIPNGIPARKAKSRRKR